MKKILLVGLLVAVLLACSGCSEGKYPLVEIQRNMWVADNLNIPIADGFILNDDKPYEIIRNDANDSLIVGIYFRKDEK